jgi:hypothetical protein
MLSRGIDFFWTLACGFKIGVSIDISDAWIEVYLDGHLYNLMVNDPGDSNSSPPEISFGMLINFAPDESVC